MNVYIVTFFIGVASTALAIPNNNELDLSPTQSRVVNGYAVDIKDVPYQASLRRRGSAWTHYCGAVIISDSALLTVGHCVSGQATDPSSLRIVVGATLRNSGGTSYNISKVIIHEQYSPLTLVNDIALLFVSGKMTLSESISPVAVASATFEISPGTEALVAGFGTISYDGASSAQLLAARVDIVSQQDCARAYLEINPVTSGMICAAAEDPLRDACSGDSGGPLVALDTLVGLVSWGEKCAEPDYPGVYTRVSYYSTWIDENLD